MLMHYVPETVTCVERKDRPSQVVAYIELIFLRPVEFNLTEFNQTCNINEV